MLCGFLAGFHELVGLVRGGDVGFGDLLTEALANCADDVSNLQHGDDCGKSTEHDSVWYWSTHQTCRNLGRGHGDESAPLVRIRELAESKFIERSGRVDQHISVRWQSGQEINLVEQGGVLNDKCIRNLHWFAGADWVVINPAVGNDGCAHPFRAEAWEGLRKMTACESGYRHQFGGRDDALTSAAMDSGLKHAASTRGVCTVFFGQCAS